MMFALAPGTRRLLLRRRAGEKNGRLPGDAIDITRDEGHGLTVYSLRLPWSRFDTAPGTFPGSASASRSTTATRARTSARC